MSGTQISDMTIDTTFPEDAYVPVISTSLNPRNNYRQQLTARINLLTGTTLAAGTMGAFASPLIDDNVSTKAAIESIGTNLAASDGTDNIGYSPSGGVAQNLTQVLADYTNSVKGFGAAGDGVTSDNDAFTDALASYDTIFVPPSASGYLITGTGVPVASGKTIMGVGSYEVGTASAVDGSIIKLDASATRAFSLLRGSDSTIDSVIFDGLAFNGSGNTNCIYGDKVRQSQFKNLRFNNLDSCIYFNEDSWLNRFENIKAFNFESFVEGNSAFEDSTFTQIIARAYRSGSKGIYLNSFSQTMYFSGVDLSETEIPLGIVISNGNCTVVLDSCYFELDTQNTRGAITASAGAGTNVIIEANGCRWFDKSGGALANSTAFEATGSGNVEIVCNGGVFSDIDRIIYDATSASLTRVSGVGNVINSGSPAIYTNVRNGARQLQFAGLASTYNLESIGALYTTTNNFGAGGTYALAFPDGTGIGIYEINFTGNGFPGGLATYLYQPKGFFANGSIEEVRDAGGNLSTSISGNTVTWTATAAADAQITVMKIA